VTSLRTRLEPQTATVGEGDPAARAAASSVAASASTERIAPAAPAVRADVDVHEPAGGAAAPAPRALDVLPSAVATPGWLGGLVGRWVGNRAAGAALLGATAFSGVIAAPREAQTQTAPANAPAAAPPTTTTPTRSASFDRYVEARAALSELPTAVAGVALRPVADGLYRVVDHIPAAIRRPFERSLSILLENAVSLPANLLTARLPFEAGALPERVAMSLPVYAQMRNSCGETMLAAWLKAQGHPIALGELDTQISFFEGGSLLVDAELRNRGYGVISGPGTLEDVRTYVAHGYPVMVSVGWPSGGGHYAVVTGYDQARGTLRVDGWHADGRVAEVPYAEFAEHWGRHLNLMMVAHPQRDVRLAELRRQGRVSRPDHIAEGLSLSDIWVTQRGELFVEGAYRHRGPRDDVTIRVNVQTPERALDMSERLGGSVSWQRRLGPATVASFYAERVPTREPWARPANGASRTDGEIADYVLGTSAAYVGLAHGPVAARVGWDRGAVQAAVRAEVERPRDGLHVAAEARAAMGPGGFYTVFFGASGRF
jgi:hypothetical protein